MEKVKYMYKELLSVYNKYSDEKFFNDHLFDDVRVWKENAERHLRIFEWNEKYWINIKHSCAADRKYFEVWEYRHFSYFNNAKEEQEKWNWCYISRSDDWRQPNNERLLAITFPTWWYIFWEDYPKELFEKFFNELKSYNPKYSDTTNNTLYFWIDDCTKIFNEFDNILKKYHEINIEDRKLRKIKKMEEELQKLRWE
jgi:hypothetical protein